MIIRRVPELLSHVELMFVCYKSQRKIGLEINHKFTLNVKYEGYFEVAGHV